MSAFEEEIEARELIFVLGRIFGKIEPGAAGFGEVMVRVEYRE